MLKNKAYRFKYLSILLSLLLIVSLSACSASEQETLPEEDVAEETEDYTIYGDESLGIDAGVDESLRNYRTILIGGIDNGNRADIQLILSINKETGEARMITVTRDAYMQIANGETVIIDDREYEFCKCNRAFENGGKYDLMKELNRHLDLNIKEFIGVDWPCAAKLIDALGGVECDIESQSMLDAINSLIESAPEGDAEFLTETGMQTLSGWQAVQYLRVRKYKGGSAFVREDRSRAFIETLLTKAKSMDIEEIADIYDEIAGDLDTNMSRSTLTDTLVQMSDGQIQNIGRWPYERTKKWDPDKHFVYQVPHTLNSNVIQLHADMFDQADYLPSTTVQELSDKISDLEENYLK